MSDRTSTSSTFEFHIHGFGPFKDFKLPVEQGDVLCIYGESGSGKTSLVQALKTYRNFLDAGPGAYDTALLRNDYRPGHSFGNIDDRTVILNQNNTDGELSLQVRYYEIEMGIKFIPSEAAFFREEYVRSSTDRKQVFVHRVGDGPDYVAFNSNFRIGEHGGSTGGNKGKPQQVDDNRNTPRSAIRDYFLRQIAAQRHGGGRGDDGVVNIVNFINRLCVVTDIDTDQLRKGGSPVRQNYHFNQHGINTFAMLAKWRGERATKKQAEWVTATLSSLFPDIEEVDLPVNGENVMAEFYHRGRRSEDSKILAKYESESVLRTLALLTAVASGQEGSFIAIDDIDIGLSGATLSAFMSAVITKAKDNAVHLLFTTRNRSAVEVAEERGAKVVNLSEAPKTVKSKKAAPPPAAA